MDSSGRLEKTLGPTPFIHETARILPDCVLGSYTDIGARTVMRNASLGDYSYVVNDCNIANTTIGKFCSIASFVRINPGNHPTWRASQHHFTYRSRQYDLADNDDDTFFDWRCDHPVALQHDIWIGHGATILPGRTVGAGAVIGAGAVVTKDVDPYTVVAGVPARTLRRRFDPGVADRLLEIGWWEWPHERLRAALGDFRRLPVEAFIEKYRPSA